MFGARSLDHGQLGPMLRRGRRWHGRLPIDTALSVPLVLPGSRSGPDPAAVAVVVSESDAIAALHALAVLAIADENPEEPSANDVRPDAEILPVHATVIDFDGQLTLELGYQAPWDDEHTIGVRFRNGALVDLCGSVTSF